MGLLDLFDKLIGMGTQEEKRRHTAACVRDAERFRRDFIRAVNRSLKDAPNKNPKDKP